MKLLNFLFIKLSICLILGILLGYYFTPSISILFQTFAVLAILFCVQFIFIFNQPIQNPVFGILTFIAFVFIGCINMYIHTPHKRADHYRKKAISTQTGFITIQLYKRLKPSKYHKRYLGNIISINQKKTSGRLLVHIDSTLAVDIDSCLISYTQLVSFSKAKNPHQFNFKQYMAKQHVSHQLFLSNNNSAYLEAKPSIYGFTNNIRKRINTNLQAHIKNPENLNIINALLLGQRQDIDKDIYQDFVQAGAIHILAISGLHIGIIMLLLHWILAPLKRFKKLQKVIPFIVIILLWSYALIAGLSASVVRAVTMFSLLTIAIHFKRITKTYNTLCIAAFILLLYNPYYLLDVGFQLSFTAVLAIITIKPLFDRLWQPRHYLLKKGYAIFSVSLAAQIGILPLSLFYFHQFPGLFMISNLIIIPVLGFLLIFGFITIITAYFNSFNQLIPLYEYSIELLQIFVSYIAKKEHFLFEQISFNSLNLISAYILIIAGVSLWYQYSTKRLIIMLSSIVIFLSALLFNKYEHQHKKEFIVFNQYKNTLIGIRKHQRLRYASLNKNTRNNIHNYVIGEFITQVQKERLQNVYHINEQNILLINKEGIYNTSFQPDIVILSQSPKINLERLINSLKPTLIIADHNNYKSDISRWKETCKKRHIPFHSTNEKGCAVIR